MMGFSVGLKHSTIKCSCRHCEDIRKRMSSSLLGVMVTRSAMVAPGDTSGEFPRKMCLIDAMCNISMHNILQNSLFSMILWYIDYRVQREYNSTGTMP